MLDEHTAALDPKTAAKVLTLSEKIVEENHLTTLMITHNMKDAIKYGNRLIMMYEGHIIYDVRGEEKKKNLQVSDLLKRFEQVVTASLQTTVCCFLKAALYGPRRRLELRNSALLFLARDVSRAFLYKALPHRYGCCGRKNSTVMAVIKL